MVNVCGSIGRVGRVLGFVAIVLVLGQQTSSAETKCGGTERWAVKVGTDDGAKNIDIQTPQSISIRQINQIPDPRYKIQKGDNTTRLDEEMNVYEVSGILRLFKYEADGDYHLVITDPSLKYSAGGAASKGKETGTSFIAEIADPKCYTGAKGSPGRKSRWAEQLREARDQFELRFPGGEGEDRKMEVPVTLVGVAFFDRDHGQIGRAKNGFEIHPVLSIHFDDEIAKLASVDSGNAASQHLIANSGFEEGDTAWVATPGVIDVDGYPDPNRGNVKAVLGNLGKAGSTFLYQVVKIPATASAATLTFRMRVRTSEPAAAGTPSDRLRIQVRDRAGKPIETLARVSNLDRSRAYRKYEFDLAKYRGRTVRIHFQSQEDKGNATSFLVDDVELRVQ